MNCNSFMKTFALILSVLSVVSCSTPGHVPQVVHDTLHDSVLVSDIRYDSIYVWQSHESDYRPDTVYIRDKSVEYRYRILRDTVRIVRCDSIPYPVTVVETGDIAGNQAGRLTCLSFHLLVGAAAALLFIKMRRVLRKQ